jgi:putative hydroxymethylpyrimidine transport system substrate-binding protein
MTFRRKTSGTGVVAVLGLAIAVAVSGCGEITNTITAHTGTANTVTVELEGAPSAYDVGIYAAQALGYFKQTDINVVLQSPQAGQDPVQMVHQNQVLVGISSEPSVFLARDQNEPLVAVAALVQVPLSQISVTLPVVHPATGGVGVGGKTTTSKTTTTTTTVTTSTGTTTTATTTKGAGTTTTGTATTTTATGTTTAGGTTTTPTTTTGATTTTTPTPAEVPTGAAWPAKLQGLLGQSAAPTYEALVFVVRKGTIVNHAPLIRRFVQAVARGFRAVRSDPSAGVADMIAADPALKPQKRVLLATVKATLPQFFPGQGKVWGWQFKRQWNAFGTWLASQGLLTNQNAIGDASSNELLQGQGLN